MKPQFPIPNYLGFSEPLGVFVADSALPSSLTMPVTVAEKAALEAFFQSRRGTRVLIVPPAADAPGLVLRALAGH